MLQRSYTKSVVLFLLFLLIAIGNTIHAQILDDSTQQLYGYHSIRYGTEEDVFFNKGLTREVDSSLASIQRYGYIYRNGQYSQDLGNWATPLKCVTAYMPSQLGVQTGFDVYSPYEYNANNIKYFDTKSPYAEIKYYQGSRGQQSIDLSVTRNINANWNAGIDLRRIVSKRIIGFVQRNDKQAENYAFDFFVSHHSKNKKYFMLASFNYLEAHNFENGGIRPDSVYDADSQTERPKRKDELFDNQLSQVWLNKQAFPYRMVRSLDKRYNYRVYQHYDLLKDDKLQVFYRFDYSRKTNRYDDNLLRTNEDFYNTFSAYDSRGKYDTSEIADRTDFNLFDNRAGVKGSSNKFFYAAYLKNRYVTMSQGGSYGEAVKLNTYTTEWYVAGQLRRYFDTLNRSYVEAVAEQGLNSVTNKSTNKNNFMGAINAFYKDFKIEVSTWAVSPTMLQRAYRSNLVSWDSSLNLQHCNRFFAGYTFRKKKIDIIPSLTYNLYENYIYFNDAGTVSQTTDKTQTQFQPKLGLRFNLWKIHIYNEFQYNVVNTESKLQMPPIVNATQLFVEAWLFKRATLLQVGFDVLYRGAYQANGYNPLIQQYYVTTPTGGDRALDYNYMNQYFVVDFFVNMQIRTARLFIKMSNLTTGKGNGYYSTPTYTAIPRTIDFGISWRFFD
jgi:hypothetical protein